MVAYLVREVGFLKPSSIAATHSASGWAVSDSLRPCRRSVRSDLPLPVGDRVLLRVVEPIQPPLFEARVVFRRLELQRRRIVVDLDLLSLQQLHAVVGGLVRLPDAKVKSTALADEIVGPLVLNDGVDDLVMTHEGPGDVTRGEVVPGSLSMRPDLLLPQRAAADV